MRQVVYWDSDAFLGCINDDKSLLDIAGCKNVWTMAERD